MTGWLDVKAAWCSAAPPSGQPAALPAEDELSGLCYYVRLQTPPTPKHSAAKQPRSSSSLMNEDQTWLISEVCTMSFKVNLIFFFFKSALWARMSVWGQLHLHPVQSQLYFKGLFRLNYLLFTGSKHSDICMYVGLLPLTSAWLGPVV